MEPGVDVVEVDTVVEPTDVVAQWVGEMNNVVGSVRIGWIVGEMSSRKISRFHVVKKQVACAQQKQTTRRRRLLA